MLKAAVINISETKVETQGQNQSKKGESGEFLNCLKTAETKIKGNGEKSKPEDKKKPEKTEEISILLNAASLNCINNVKSEIPEANAITLPVFSKEINLQTGTGVSGTAELDIAASNSKSTAIPESPTILYKNIITNPTQPGNGDASSIVDAAKTGTGGKAEIPNALIDNAAPKLKEENVVKKDTPQTEPAAAVKSTDNTKIENVIKSEKAAEDSKIMRAEENKSTSVAYKTTNTGSNNTYKAENINGASDNNSNKESVTQISADKVTQTPLIESTLNEKKDAVTSNKGNFKSEQLPEAKESPGARITKEEPVTVQVKTPESDKTNKIEAVQKETQAVSEKEKSSESKNKAESVNQKESTDKFINPDTAITEVYSPKQNIPENVGVGETAVTQISRAVKEIKKQGNGKFTMELAPKELGRVTVELKYKEGKLDLTINAQSNETAKVIKEQIGELKTALTSGNVEVNNIEVGNSSNIGLSFTNQQYSGERYGSSDRSGNSNTQNSYYQAYSEETDGKEPEAPLRWNQLLNYVV